MWTSTRTCRKRYDGEANGVNVALSNPCFELWLILHLRDAPGMIHRHAAQAMLKRLVADYDKNVDYEVYRIGYDKAAERARKLDELAAKVGEPGRNPTTGVYKLTETIVPRKIGRILKTWSPLNFLTDRIGDAAIVRLDHYLYGAIS